MKQKKQYKEDETEGTFSYLPDYFPISVIGRGSFGIVLKAYDRNHNYIVALKMSHKVGPKLGREYDMLTQLKDCDHVVKLLDAYYTFDEKRKLLIQNLVLEYLPIDLRDYLYKVAKNKECIPIDKIKSISKQILLGLKYMHQKNIVHRDLKPENILVSEEEKVVKIADFGLAKTIPNKSDFDIYDLYYDPYPSKVKSAPTIGNIHYRAPEMLFGKTDYDSKIDIFAAGLIIGELFTREPLFQGLNVGLQILEYINVLGKVDFDYLTQFNIPEEFRNYLKEYKIDKFYSFNEILNEDKKYKSSDIDLASDLLSHMINWDYRDRFSAEQCLKHKFFNDSDSTIYSKMDIEIKI